MTAAAPAPAPAEIPAKLTAVRGIVFDVQRMSMHDGPGVRTNVFLKGCPLRCAWCANPESQELQPQVSLHEHNCIECGQFAQPCPLCRPDQAHTTGLVSAGQVSADGAIDLVERIDLCPTGAIHWVGAWRSAGEVMAEVRRDRPFYGHNGGLTLTGGEPTMQPALCEALLTLARLDGIHTAIETCGHTQWAVYERLLPWLDLVLFDVKHVDPEIHRRHTGADNTLILANLQRLAAAGVPLRVRVPLIPGFNADPASLQAICAFVLSLPSPVQAVDLLPYHTLGRAKYAALGRPYPWTEHARLPDAEVAALAALAQATGLPVTVGG